MSSGAGVQQRPQAQPEKTEKPKTQYLCKVDAQHPAVQLGTVHVVNSIGGIRLVLEFHEAETPVLARGVIQRDGDVFDVAKGDEGRVEDGL